MVFERLSRASALSGAKRIESEDRFEATFDQAAVGIALVAPDGRWLRVNDRLCEILGYDQEALLQTNFHNLTYPEDLNSDLENVRAMLAHEISSCAMEKRYIRKDGDILWALLNVSMVSDESGAPSYFIAVIEDIDLLGESKPASCE